MRRSRMASGWRMLPACAAILIVVAMTWRPGIVLAQAENEFDTLLLGSEPHLAVTSTPPGAIIRLIGDYEFVGRTPWDLHRPLQGLYRVEALIPGYETWKSTVLLGEGGMNAFHVTLSKKSGLKAAMRSAILPGWGQKYNESKPKMWVFSVAQACGLTAMAITYYNYDKKADNFKDAKQAYEAERNIANLPALWANVESTNKTADKYWDRYLLAAGISAGIYAANLLDAFFFGPDTIQLGQNPTSENEGEAVEEDTSMNWFASPNLEGGTVGVRIQW